MKGHSLQIILLIFLNQCWGIVCVWKYGMPVEDTYVYKTINTKPKEYTNEDVYTQKLPEYEDVKICDGMTNPSPKAFPILKTSGQLEYLRGCTHIRGSVVLSNIEPDDDLSGLRSIVEISGALIIHSCNNVLLFPFTNLRQIRGDETLQLRINNEDILTSLSIQNNNIDNEATGIMDFRSLRSVLKHDISIHNNKGYCFLTQVNWQILLDNTQQQVHTVTEETNASCTSFDSSCDSSCPLIEGTRFCFGPSQSQCQTAPSNLTCPSRCSGGCYMSDDQVKCYACRYVRFRSECRKSCPTEQPLNQDNFCVKRCHRFFLLEGRKCVPHCTPRVSYPSDDFSKCLPCCANTCENVCWQSDLEQRTLARKPEINSSSSSIFVNGKALYTWRSVMHALENCTVYDGNVDIGGAGRASLSKGSHGEHIRQEDLAFMRNLKRINGNIFIELVAYPNVTSLYFFSSLEEINSCQFLIVGNENLEYLGLKSLNHIRAQAVLIVYALNLCYMENFKKRLNGAAYEERLLKSKQKCKRECKVCRPFCKRERGCWGPGDMCA